VIQRHAMRNAAATVVPDYREPVKPEVFHHFHLVQRHGALRVIRMVLLPRPPPVRLRAEVNRAGPYAPPMSDGRLL